MSDDRETVVRFGAEITDALGGLESITTAVRESVDDMKAHLASLTETAGMVSEAFVAIGAVLAGGEIFREAVDKVSELGKELEIGAQKTGIASEELSRLRYAADLSDVSSGELMIGLQRLSRSIEEAGRSANGPAAAALRELGIRATDSAGRVRPLNEVLLELSQHFAGMEDGAGKTAIAMDLFGRSGANLIPLLDQGAGGIQALEREADKLGATMSERDVEATNEYVDAMKRWHAETDGIKRDFVVGLLPALTDLSNLLQTDERDMTVARAAGMAFGDMIRTVASAVVIAVGALEALGDAAHLNFGRAKSDIDQTIDRLKVLWKGFNEVTHALDTDNSLTNALFPKKPPPVVDKGDLMQKLEQQWLAIKEQNTDNFGQLTQLELDFWKSKLSLAEAGSKDYLEIRRHIVDLELQVAQQGYEGELAVLKAKEQADKDDLAQVVADRQAELELIRKHYAETSKEVQEGIARVNEAQQSLQKQTAKQWEDTFNAIPAAFGEAMKGIGKNVQSMRDLFREFFLDLTKMSIEWGAKTLEHHIATELAKKDVTAESVAERVALESWAAIQSVAQTAWAALTNIGNYAAEAIAGAWAALVAIPFVGPFIAPAVAIGTGAAVLALAGNIHSAAGGFDIPTGLNPVTQLHSQEMVLPADLANRVRGMTDGSHGGGDVHLHVHTLDTKTMKQWMHENRGDLAKVVKKAVKDGRVV